MYVENRAVVLIERNQPFLDWLQGLPDPRPVSSLESVNDEPSSYLVSNGIDGNDITEELKEVYHQIFEVEMNEWWTNKDDWEKTLSWSKFNEWFSYKICSMPYDLCVEKITYM